MFCLVVGILGLIFFIVLFIGGIHWIDIIFVLIHAAVLLGEYFVGKKVLEGLTEAREEQLRTFSSI
jgi:hypothetical protein